ncbi:MAG: exo-alpha-sialidase [Candidatus Hydrogenedentes bacterium]|nr:exo-alpha-sialidase [Candidatus Hydrogenedentota bacterium]
MIHLRTHCVMFAICALVAPCAFGAFGFSSSAALNSGAATDGSLGDEDPAVAADGSGTMIAVWSSNNPLTITGTDSDIHFSRSTNNGAVWSTASQLNSFAGVDSFGDFQPSIAGDGKGNWVCVWESSHNLAGAGTDKDIFAATSTDDGVSWSDAVPVSSNATEDGNSTDEYSTIVTDGKGHWVCVWHSNNDLGTEDTDDYDVLVARSSDNGETWSNVQPLNTNAAADTGYDMDPRIETDRDGTWIAVWESDNELGAKNGGDGDLLYAKSTDNGQTWTENTTLNTDADTDTGYETFPSIATDRQGNWVVTWEGNAKFNDQTTTDYEAMTAHSTDNGDTWSTPIAINNDAETDGNYDSEPVVATDGVGTWIATWRKDGDSQSPFGEDVDIVAAKSTDNGATWTSLDALNTSMTSDSGGDVYAALDTDRDGNWICVWRSNDTLGDTIGTDVDILFATLQIEVPTLTVTKPNGGEKWTVGNQETIEWETTGDAGNKVVIELLKGSNVIDTIKGKTKNDGQFSWTVPNSVNTGKGYKVRVYSKSNANITDDSDGKLKIK